MENSVSLEGKIFLPFGECVWSFSAFSVSVCCGTIFFACVGATWKESCVYEQGEKHFIDLSKCPTEKGRKGATTSFTNSRSITMRKLNELEKFNWLNYIAGISSESLWWVIKMKNSEPNFYFVLHSTHNVQIFRLGNRLALSTHSEESSARCIELNFEVYETN